MTTKTNKGGRPRVDSERVDVRFRRATLDALDAWREKQDDAPARPEAIRRLVEAALKGTLDV